MIRTLRILGRSLSTALTAVALVLTTPLASAQSDDATRAGARSLGYDGVKDFQAGSFASAADKLDRAYRALRVPSLGLWSARAFEKTGKLVAASERYVEVQRLDPGSGDVAVQKQAQADAETDNAALLPRIPSVVIMLEGASADTVTVSVNGASVPSSLIGLKRLVDPGTIKVEGQSSGLTATETVTLREGETKTVTLRFNAAGLPAVPVAAAAGAAPPANDASHPTDGGGARSGSGQRTVAWIALGVGAAGIVTGAVAGSLAMSKRSSTQGCEGTRCPPSAQDDVDAYNSLRTISSAGFIAGGVLAATGVVLILTAPSSAGPKSAARATSYRLSPWVGADGAGVTLGVTP